MFLESLKIKINKLSKLFLDDLCVVSGLWLVYLGRGWGGVGVGILFWV